MRAPTKSAVEVRPATVRDLVAIAAIEEVSFSDPWTYDALATALGLSHVRFLVAEERGGPVGRVVGYVVALVVGEEGEIADLAVHPAHRRGGVGDLLLTRVEDELAGVGVRALYLEVRESNEAALRLYRSRGFEGVGRRRGYYRHPVEDALVLRRALAPT
jgi:ribosomal-protein-alanine N-acetyltransferase